MTITGRLFALMFLAVPLVAAAPPSDPNAEKDRKICREAEPRLGSRIKTPRRCRTVEQWQEEDQARPLPLSAQVTEGQGDALQKQRPQ
ncbi:MAG TPA: hypothetical protein VK485_03995 [Sphingomicrobium sp.]|nr:hypothetical protein [Sphingomicrobium sp.]